MGSVDIITLSLSFSLPCSLAFAFAFLSRILVLVLPFCVTFVSLFLCSFPWFSRSIVTPLSCYMRLCTDAMPRFLITCSRAFLLFYSTPVTTPTLPL